MPGPSNPNPNPDPDVHATSRLLGTLGMKNARAKFDAAQKAAAQKLAPTKSQFDAETAPATSDTGVPDKLVEAMSERRGQKGLKDQLNKGEGPDFGPDKGGNRTAVEDAQAAMARRKGNRRSRMYTNPRSQGQ